MDIDFTWIKDYPEYDYQFSASSPIKGIAYFFRAKGGTGTILFPEAIVQEDQILFEFVSSKTGTINDDLSQADAWFQTLFTNVKCTFGKQLNKFDSQNFLKMHPYRESFTAFHDNKRHYYFCQHIFLERGTISIPNHVKHEDDVTFSFEERHPNKTITDLAKMPEWFQRLVNETKRRVSRETRIRNIFTESR